MKLSLIENSTGTMKKILIAEFKDELNGFIDYCHNHRINLDEFLVVAFQADVQVRCREKGLNYINTLPFFNTASHVRVLEKSHELTSLIAKQLSFNMGKEIDQVLMDTFIFYSRFYLNNYLWIIEVLEGIRKEYGETVELYVYPRSIPGGEEGYWRSPYLLKKDRYLHTIAQKYCTNNEIKCHLLEKNSNQNSANKLVSTGIIKYILRNITAKLFSMKIRKLSHFPVVFTAAPSYYLDRVTRDIQSVHPEVLAVTDYHLPEAISNRGYIKLCLLEIRDWFRNLNYTNQLISIPIDLYTPQKKEVKNTFLEQIKPSFERFSGENHQQFIYLGCSFWEEFQFKVENDLLEALAKMLTSSLGRSSFLEQLKPQLVMSPVSTAEYQDWARVARSKNIPALVIPQKTLLKPANSHACIEEYYIGRAQVTDTFANVAAQSPLVTEYLKWSNYQGNILETGNLIFARLSAEKKERRRAAFFKEIGGDKKVIMWAPSMKTRKSRRFYVLESIDELLSAMEGVFSVVSRMDDVHLIFRIHPGDAITKKEIYALLEVPENVSVSDSGTYEDVLALADLLISYSSTAVQEALINYIPVLFYDKWNRYNHLESDEIVNETPKEISSTYYLHKTEYLASSIKWILEMHTKKEIPGDLFKKFIFLDSESKFNSFIRFVESCVKQ